MARTGARITQLSTTLRGRLRPPVTPPARAAAPAPAPTLRRADVERLYELLLERPASAPEVDLQLADCTDAVELAQRIMASDERRRLEARAAERLRDEQPAFPNVWVPELADLALQPGTVSEDGVAEVGRDGVLFLVGGSNDLREQLAGRTELDPGWEDGWRAAVTRNAEQVEALGARAVWLVVPDKAVVDVDRLPQPVDVAGRPLVTLRERLGLDLCYPVEELRAVTPSAYLAIDTHLTLEGNRALAEVCLAAIGAPPPPALGSFPTRRLLISGDLGGRFEPRQLEVRHIARGWPVEVVEDTHPQFAALGGHVGTRQVLRKADAPDPRVCLVFGDSYSFSSTGYQGLIWWLSLVFREVHFVWQPFGWDPGYAERVGAEVVVFAGAERFCVRVPPEPADVEAVALDSLSRLHAARHAS